MSFDLAKESELNWLMSKEHYEGFTPEDQQQIIEDAGRVILGLMFSMEQLRHVTLGGHLVYHHVDQTDPSSVAGQIVHWLRWLNARGEEEKNTIGKPSWLLGYAFWYISGRLFDPLVSETQS